MKTFSWLDRAASVVPLPSDDGTNHNDEQEVTQMIVPGFNVLILSVSGEFPNHKWTRQHIDRGFFQRKKYARYAARKGQQLGRGFMTAIQPNFIEMDVNWQPFIRELYSYDGNPFIEFIWYPLSPSENTIRVVSAIDLPDPPEGNGRLLGWHRVDIVVLREALAKMKEIKAA